MDGSVHQTDFSLRLGTSESNADENKTTTAASVVMHDLNELVRTSWTSTIIFRLSVNLLLMLLTLIGNVIVIITIVSCAELRKKRVNVFILNLAVGDLIVFLVSTIIETHYIVSGRWRLGFVGCKLAASSYVVTIGFPTFLLTFMSVDRYQVKDDA